MACLLLSFTGVPGDRLAPCCKVCGPSFCRGFASRVCLVPGPLVSSMTYRHVIDLNKLSSERSFVKQGLAEPEHYGIDGPFVYGLPIISMVIFHGEL